MLFYTIHVVILVFGGVLLLRKAGDIDGYHWLKVVVLTTIFSLPVFAFGLVYVYLKLFPPYMICVSGR